MKDEAIHTRPAQAEDMPAIGRIVVQSWRHTFNGLVGADFLDAMSVDHQRQRHERMFAYRQVIYHVAILGDEVVGFCSGGPSRKPAYGAQNEIYAIILCLYMSVGALAVVFLKRSRANLPRPAGRDFT